MFLINSFHYSFEGVMVQIASEAILIRARVEIVASTSYNRVKFLNHFMRSEGYIFHSGCFFDISSE